MSERVSFLSRAMTGRSLGTVRSVLKRRGINLAADINWQTTEERYHQIVMNHDSWLYAPLSMPIAQGLPVQTHEKLSAEISKAKGFLKTIESVPLFSSFIGQKNGEKLESLRQDLSKIDHFLLRSGIKPGGESELLQFASKTRAGLLWLVATAQSELCDVEREATLQVFSDSFSELGYLVKREGESLKATQNQTCVLVERNLSDGFSMDLSGFSGLSCLQEMNKIELEFKRRGLVLERTFTNFHGEPGTQPVTCEPASPLPDFQRVKVKKPVQGTLQWETTKAGG